MAEDDTDRVDEYEAERTAEIEDELERIGRDPAETDADGSVGSQSSPRRDEQTEPEAEPDNDEPQVEPDAETDAEAS
ncbi:hypothetical protein ACLI4Y_06160 [Natrialbaceae archaeon A-CW3]